MTRKCIMCKGKNYKNAYSFFSAPKDAETRRLWQEAINIQNYTVNDDTYVCSKHFNKEDIITHWVSGVPPQVITIKYKKCRLRRGAVPVPINKTINSNSDISSDIQNNGIILDGKTYFIESKKKEIENSNKIHKTEESLTESLNCNLEDEIYEYIPEDSQEPDEIENEVILAETSKRQKLIDNSVNKEEIIYSTTTNKEILFINCTNISDTELHETDSNVEIHINNAENILTYFPKRTYSKLNEKEIHKSLRSSITEDSDQIIINSPINWQVDTMNERLETNEIDKLHEELNTNSFEYTNETIQQITDPGNNSMLFEDFLEIYNEVLLPTSWFASIASKGHATTIVYSCMNISSTGMPYVEKTVFLNNEMILRCGVFNKEINIINLLKNGKSPNVYTLSDVENFVEEYDQTPVCTGILDENCVNKSNPSIFILYGDKWRHSQCSMVLSKGQSICLQCASLVKDKSVNNK